MLSYMTAHLTCISPLTSAAIITLPSTLVPTGLYPKTSVRFHHTEVTTSFVLNMLIIFFLFREAALVDIIGDHSSKQDQRFLLKIGKNIGFCLHRRSYLLCFPVITVYVIVVSRDDQSRDQTAVSYLMVTISHLIPVDANSIRTVFFLVCVAPAALNSLTPEEIMPQ